MLLLFVICHRRIEIEFLHFELEAEASCEFDVLEVREGGEPQGPLVGRFCGHERPASYVSSSNKLYFNFRSDYSVSQAGFRIRYKTGQGREERREERGDLFYLFCLSACGGEFSTPSGIIRSPYHPANYPHHRHCKYTIAAPAGNVIQLQFR